MFDVTNHAIRRYQERINKYKAPDNIRKLIEKYLKEEIARPTGRKHICSVAREKPDGTFMYFYLPALSSCGKKFYISVSHNARTAYTVLTVEQFKNLKDRV